MSPGAFLLVVAIRQIESICEASIGPRTRQSVTSHGCIWSTPVDNPVTRRRGRRVTGYQLGLAMC